MSTTDQLIIGPLSKSRGNPAPLTGSFDSGQRVLDSHGRYLDAVLNGNVYIATSQALATLQTGLTTAQTGLGLFNPIGSGKYLSILHAACGLTIAATNAAIVGLCTNTTSLATPTGQTAATYRNALLGGGNAPVGLPMTGCTLAVAPTALNVLGVAQTGLITTQTLLQPIQRELAGELIIGEGVYVGFFSSAAVATSSFWAELIWEELIKPT